MNLTVYPSLAVGTGVLSNPPSGSFDFFSLRFCCLVETVAFSSEICSLDSRVCVRLCWEDEESSFFWMPLGSGDREGDRAAIAGARTGSSEHLVISCLLVLSCLTRVRCCCCCDKGLSWLAMT